MADTRTQELEICGTVKDKEFKRYKKLVSRVKHDQQEEIKDRGCKPRELYQKYGNAVVRIMSEISLTGNGAPVTGIPGDLTSYFLFGNGFFIRKNTIVCPASLVLIPPTILATNNRFPFVSETQSAPTGVIPNTITKVSRILVTVFDVAGCCKSYVYSAKLQGVDGAGDVAVLKICKKTPWNLSNPCLSKHCHFNFSKSREYCPGEKIYAIGDFVTSPFNGAIPLGFQAATSKPGITDGLLADNRFMDYFGWALPELVLTNLNAYFVSTGMPIIDRWGRIVAMQTTSTPGFVPAFNFTITVTSFPTTVSVQVPRIGDGYVAGISEFFMKRIVQELNCARKGKKPACDVVLVKDNIGDYFRYRKGYLGIHYNVVSGLEYDITINPITGKVTEDFDASGGFQQGPECKNVVGVRVVAIAGDTTTIGNALVPGAIPPLVVYPSLVNSPLLATVGPNDIITHIGKCPLGNLNNQIPPSLITWRHGVRDPLHIWFRSSSNNYDSTQKTTITPAEMPLLMDYPWYKIADFPLVTAPNVPPGPHNPQIPSTTFVPAV